MHLGGGILFLWSRRIAPFIERRIRISKMCWGLLIVDFNEKKIHACIF